MTYDPVLTGLAAGLRPADLDDAVPADTISAADLAMIGVTAKLARIEKLAERQTAAAERAADAADRAADAAERQADAFEVIAGLLASVTGVAQQWCPGDERETSPVNYLRCSDSGKNFQCDKGGDDED